VPPLPEKSFQKLSWAVKGVLPDEGEILANTPPGNPSTNIDTVSVAPLVDTTEIGMLALAVELVVRSTSRTPVMLNVADEEGVSSPDLVQEAIKRQSRKNTDRVFI
jgi:hypothetical protein